MTTDELNAIVQAVMLEMEKAGVDFDFKAETPQPTDLVYVMRGTSDKYQGITVKWQNLLDIIVQKATEARDDAVSAKNIALETLATIQGIENNVSSMKSSVETTKSQVETMKGEVSTMKASVETSEANVTQMKSDVSEMKASVEGTKTEVEGLKSDVTTLKSQTQTIVDNAKEDVTGLLDTKVNYTDALTYKQIMASPDLSGKVASASALKELATLDLLWANANTYTAFEGQTITLDLSPYKGIYIEIQTNGSPDIIMGYIHYGIGDSFLISGVGTGSDSISENSTKIAFARMVSTSTVGITFGNGLLNYQTSSYVLSNQYAIPHKIYGIK